MAALGGCSSDTEDSGSGGSPGVGGLSSVGGTTSSTAGSTSTAGAGKGGSPSGGSPSGGSPSGGTGGAPSGGAPSGGSPSAGAPSGGTGGGTGGTAMGGSTGSGGGGSCQKGTTKGKEVLFIGESFVAASTIPEETSKLAIAAGSLMQGDGYIDKSVSGTWIGNGASNSIPNQYKSNSSGVRFVLMNGGGNDCWQGGQESHRTAALNAAKQLFQDMATNKVEKVVYFFYPDPVGGSFSSLKSCLDILRPAMKAVCDEQQAPKCYWVDLRETWNGHNEYTSDGIHVAGPGNAPTAAAIFKSMQDNCVAP